MRENKREEKRGNRSCWSFLFWEIFILERRKKERKKERKKSMFSIECRRTGRGPIVTRGVNVCGKNECFHCHTNYISH